MLNTTLAQYKITAKLGQGGLLKYYVPKERKAA
jgi:hypothetical protein